jgi:hypothetical protein
MTDEIELDPRVEEQAILLEEELKNLPDKKNINMNASSSHRSICSILRDIYHKSEDEEIKNLCIEATIKAKKMTRKLVDYKIKKQSKLVNKK